MPEQQRGEREPVPDLLAALQRSIDKAREHRAPCGCVIGGTHRYACASVGHVDPPRVTPPASSGGAQ